ncbi:MAG: synthase [Bacteroidota bacterium]|jgi:NAD+ synthase
MQAIIDHIVNWLEAYKKQASSTGFVVGISGGIDSALSSTLCALTGAPTLCVTLPIRQGSAEYERAQAHLLDLKSRFSNVQVFEIDLSNSFSSLENAMPFKVSEQPLAMANTRSRLRMATLYALAQANNCLVVGTGNKIEDFGVGFFTKYGDGGVDLSPIADLYKTEVFKLAKALRVIDAIQQAAPTDGLWEDGRSDEDQMGATYPELEWAMQFHGNEQALSARQQEVLRIYRRLNTANQHKMKPIPVCEIPASLKALF